MPKTILSTDDITQIITLYKTTIPSTHKLAEKFNVGHKKISKILLDNNIQMNTKGGQATHNQTKLISSAKTNIYSSEKMELIAKCKKTGATINDPNNLSGALTEHIIKVYGDVPIPSNTYQRKKYELENGKKWFEEYFDIIELDKKPERGCKLCEWVTEDITNKTGCFEVHINDMHQISIGEYLTRFPEDLELHPKFKEREKFEKELNRKENHIICKICNKKLKYLTSTHLAKHDITLLDYKLNYPNEIFLSESYVTKLKDTYETGLKLHENKFSSKPQLEIAEFIRSFGFEVKSNDKKLLGGVEIDILIEELKLGIEYNGLYYHTEKMGKARQFHLTKTRLMNRAGYKLIHIFEDEWVANRELIKNKISHLIGRNTSQSIGGRKCVLRAISTEEKNTFLTKYHIQGRDKAGIHFGAIYNNEIVGVMCFDNRRSMSLVGGDIDERVYELTRFATNVNFRVPGIADRLLKLFISTYNPEKIISFGDARWVLDAADNMYTKLGFELTKIYPPDYRYYNPKVARYKRLHKFGFGKSSLKKKYPHLDFTKTEKELTIELGFDRIWDCGLFKYELMCNQAN